MFKSRKMCQKGINNLTSLFYVLPISLAKMHLTETNEMSKPYYINVYNLCVKPQPIIVLDD
jgi:hypothetical protein